MKIASALELLREGRNLTVQLDQTSPITFRERKPKAVEALDRAIAILASMGTDEELSSSERVALKAVERLGIAIGCLERLSSGPCPVFCTPDKKCRTCEAKAALEKVFSA